MGQDDAHSVLARLLRKAGNAVVASNVTPTRALRLSMARAAERSVGLHLTVGDVTQEVLALDECLAQLTSDHMLLGLSHEGGLRGLAAFDLQLRSATVEVQTIGQMHTVAAPARKITAADAALCGPLVTQLLADLTNTAVDTPLEGWADGLECGRLIEDVRSAGMMLSNQTMRIVRFRLVLSPEGREAELVLALPSGTSEATLSKEDDGPSFAEQIRKVVMDAPSDLHAVLHRFAMPLQALEALSVDQEIALPGVSVRSVTLEDPNGKVVALARLGQVTGLRAVRIEAASKVEMSERAVNARSLQNANNIAGEVTDMSAIAGGLIEAQADSFDAAQSMDVDQIVSDSSVPDNQTLDPALTDVATVATSDAMPSLESGLAPTPNLEQQVTQPQLETGSASLTKTRPNDVENGVS